MRKILAAILGVVLLATPAFAGCSQPAETTPMRGYLPISAHASQREMAEFALPYFQLFLAMDRDVEAPGYIRVGNNTHFLSPDDQSLAGLTGFYAEVFEACATNTVVVTIDNTTNFADLIGGALRRLNDGWSVLAPRFVAAVIATYPGQFISVIGHSAGGNMASQVAGLYDLTSIIFNGARTDASVYGNDGSKQLVAYVEGDRIGDPDGNEYALAGLQLVLPYTGGDRAHKLTSLAAGFEHLLFPAEMVASAR